MSDGQNGNPVDNTPSHDANSEKETEGEDSSRDSSAPVIINVKQTNEHHPQPQHKAPKPYRDSHDRWHLGLFIVGVIISGAALGAAIAGAIFAFQEIQAIRETARIPVRAYILPNPMREVWSLKGAPNTYINLRSSGVTPAKNVALRVTMKVMARDSSQPDFDG